MSENQETPDGVKTELPIEAWKKESPNGEVYLIEYEDDEFYFITPNRAKFTRFVDNAMRSSYGSMTTLLLDCLKHPDSGVFLSRIEKSPQIVSVLANSLTKALGIDTEAAIKKV